LVTKLQQRLALLRPVGLGCAHLRLAIATTKVEQMRTGHWEMEHFVPIWWRRLICLGWPEIKATRVKTKSQCERRG
jgi:hypothetical protein